jgi:RNA polymerase sigma-70 factor (ECF subfamily)
MEITASQRRLYAYVYSLLGNREESLDVVQEVNLVLWRRASEFQPGTNFIAFAFKIAYFQVLAHRKRSQRDKLLFDDELLNEIAHRCQNSGDDDTRERALEACMEKLPAQHRELLRQRYTEENPIDMIAAKANRSVGSIAMLLHRIRMSLIRCVTRTLSLGGA